MSSASSHQPESRPAVPRPIPDLAADRPPECVTDGDAVRLRAGRSDATGAWAFPLPPAADGAGGEAMREVHVGPAGTLYSHSTIHVSSSRPVPYTLGYVDFPEGLRVLAVVRHDDPAALACDAPVVLRGGDDGGWWVEPEAAS